MFCYLCGIFTGIIHNKDMAKEKEDIKKEAPEVEKPEKDVKAEKKCKVQEKDKVKELTDKLSKEHDDFLRLMAEFETFRRRSAEERLALINTASADTIKELLPVLDACEQAMKMLAGSEDEAAKQGTALIFDKLMESLKKRGLKVIEAKGEKFDADRHEAIAQIPAPTEELKGVVIDVTRTGYELGGKIIRYPQVVVGA